MSSRSPNPACWLAALVLLLVGAPGRPAPDPAALRVCGDPDNLPFSNQRREGFENRIADLLAADLHQVVQWSWRPLRRGFVGKAVNSGQCDVVMGVPVRMDQLLKTAPYYRSSYVFLSRRDRHLAVHSIQDSVLRSLKIGVQLIEDDGADTPPSYALSRRGIIHNVKGFVVPDEHASPGARPRIIDAVIHREVDVAVVWGPLAGYWARHSPAPLTITEAEPPDDLPFLPFAFDIAIGVRLGQSDLRDQIDAALARRRGAISRILQEYGVPASGISQVSIHE